MKLSDVASVAEIIASVGVVLSLVFVGIQLNEGNREARAATVQAVLSTEMDMVTVFINHSSTWEKVVTGAPLVEGEETRKATNLYNLAMLEASNRYLQYRSGYLEEESWEGTFNTLPGLKSLPIYEQWRQSFGGQGQDSEFLDLLDKL